MESGGPFRRVRNPFLRDAATLQAAGLVTQLTQAASTVLIARLLGASGQGVFVSAVSLHALFYFVISVGVSQATVSQVAAARARQRYDKLAGWLAFMAKSVLVLGSGLTILGWFALPAASRVMYGATTTIEQPIGFWAWLLCFQVILEAPRSVVGVALHGTRRMYSLGKVEAGHELLRLGAVGAGASLTRSPLGAIVGALIASLASSCFALWVYRSARRAQPESLPSVRAIVQRMPRVPLWRGLRMGLRAGIVKNISMLVLTVLPRLAIGVVASVEWVAYFHIAQRILEIPLKFMLGVSRTVLPALSELAGLRELASFRRLFWRATGISGLMVAGGTLGAMPFVRPLVGAFFPASYVEPVWDNYWTLALGYIPFGFGTAIEAFYLATNRIKWWVGLTLFGISYSIPVHLWLIVNVPFTGTAAGMVCYHSFVLVHLTYIALWFSRQDAGSAWSPRPAVADS